MSANQDSRFDHSVRAAFRSVLRAVIAASLVLGAAGTARAQDAGQPAPPAPATETPPADPAKPSEPAPPAAEAPAPKNYVTALVGTTVFYVSNGGDSSGWQHDIGPGIGYGRLVTPTIAVELDVIPVFIRGEYDNTILVPGATLTLSTHFYAAARFLVKVDPEFNFTIFPGIGVVHSFANGLGFSLELNVGSTVGKGEPDFAVGLTPGVLYSF
jgi:hypothetical protein